MKVVLRAEVGVASSANRRSLCESRLCPVRLRQLKVVAAPAAAAAGIVSYVSIPP